METSDLKVPYEKILVRRDPEQETIGSAGLVRAEISKDKALTGTVVAVGCGRLLADGRMAPMLLKVGDRVLISRYGGLDLPDDLGFEKGLAILREDEVIAYWQEPATS